MTTKRQMRRMALVAASAAILASMAVTLRANSPVSSAQQAVPDNLAQHTAPAQPLPFSHKKHVTTVALPCTFCHTNPEPGTQMTFPPTSTCMTCHVAIATDSPAVKRLTELSQSGGPIDWQRVYQLPRGITWNHRTHLQAGMQCVMCHGDVTKLEQMAQITSVTAMASCIGCHEAHGADNRCQTCHAWPAEHLQPSAVQ